MIRPTKTVLLGDRGYTLVGLSETDPYFRSISDDFEEEFVTFCRQHVSDDAVCFDIGANIGLKTICLSQTAPRGTIVAVEAAPEIAALLEANVKANRLRNVRVVHSAVGAENGEVAFLAHSAYGHVAEAGSENTTTVPLRRLATILDEQQLDRLDFIKLDVEGYEFTILQDAIELIDRHRAVVLLEFNAWCQLAFADVNPRSVMQWLFGHFCYIARLTRPGEGGNLLERIYPEDALDLLHRNLVYDHCVTDLVVTNFPERLDVLPRVLTERLRATTIERDAAVAERDAANLALAAVREQASAELAAFRGSTSWRVTAPLRRLSGLIRGLGRHCPS